MWYKINFRLEDFGHHNAQLVSRNYLTYSFFSPTQVTYALSEKEDLISHQDYEPEAPVSTPAVPEVLLEMVQRLYTIRNSPLDLGKYPTFGKVFYLPPGTTFETYSQIAPQHEVIFIGKKRRVGRIISVRPVEAQEIIILTFTSPDLISQENFRRLALTEYQVLAMSQRWIFGRFKVKKCLRIGDDYFVSPIISEEAAAR